MCGVGTKYTVYSVSRERDAFTFFCNIGSTSACIRSVAKNEKVYYFNIVVKSNNDI